MSVDGIEKAIGRFGRYQAWILFLLYLGRLPAEFELSDVVFLIPQTDFTCMDDLVPNITNYCPCEDPVFDRSTMLTSVTSDFKLICGRKPLSSFTQSMLQAGIAAGSLFYGYISDRFGRRIALIFSMLCNSVFGTLSSLSPRLWMFIVCRFLSGTAVGGTMLCCFVMLIELCGKSFRPQTMGLIESVFVVAYILQAILAYNIREWRYLQMAMSTPWLLVMAYYWLIPESPRWLITVGRKKEAVDVLNHIAKRNNRPTDNIAAVVEQIEAETLSSNSEQRSGSYYDLFRTPRIRVYSIITPFIWAACALSFFGINQHIGRLGGNIYLNVLLSAVFLIPAPILLVFASLHMRRKVTLITCFMVTALSLWVILALPKHMETVILAFAIIGQIGAFNAFLLIYLFTTEIFPTVIRNSAMGMCSVFGRVGGVAAPFVVNIGIEWVSVLIISVLALIAAIACILLPETKNIILFNSIEQTENAPKSDNDDCKKKNSVL